MSATHPTAPQQAHWHDPNPREFTAAQRATTTILFGGLTGVQDKLLETAMARLGYRAEALPCADDDALQLGKEFGSRGQCNPTYYTVGNLVRHLVHLRDELGLRTEQIVKDYLFVTAGACLLSAVPATAQNASPPQLELSDRRRERLRNRPGCGNPDAVACIEGVLARLDASTSPQPVLPSQSGAPPALSGTPVNP